LKKFEKTHGTAKRISDEVLQTFLRYTWPGNVRQLESVLERSYILCEGDSINLDHVPAEVKQGDNAEISLSKLRSTIDYLIDAKLTAAEYRLYLYLTKLDPLNSNFQELTEPREIIERLGINRDTFFVGIAKLKELGLYDLKEKLSLSKQITRKTN